MVHRMHSLAAATPQSSMRRRQAFSMTTPMPLLLAVPSEAFFVTQDAAVRPSTQTQILQLAPLYCHRAASRPSPENEKEYPMKTPSKKRKSRNGVDGFQIRWISAQHRFGITFQMSPTSVEVEATASEVQALLAVFAQCKRVVFEQSTGEMSAYSK